MNKPFKKGNTQEGIITLGSGHSIMIGHKPLSITDEALANNHYNFSKLNESIDSFGLFGNDPNYNTYYPNVTSEDFMPKDSEYIEPVYRLLSECIVSKYYPTDFSIGNVLKKSMKMLIGQTVNCDHETSVGNAIGVVKSVFWQEAYTDEATGLTIPAGINGTLKIDAKANPRLARGILMEPPSIHSNSVTVRFTWEKSHKEMDDREFYDKIGQYDAAGNLIKRNVNKIIGFFETSLVSQGADPFAKKIGSDGNITHADDAHRVYSFNESITSNHFFFRDFKDSVNRTEGVDVLHNTALFINEKEYNPITISNQVENEKMEELLNALFGEGMLAMAEGQEANAETAISLVTQLVADKVRLTSELAAALEKDDEEPEELVNLRAQVETEKPLVEIGTTALSELRNKATSDYQKLMGDKVEPGIISLIASGDYKTVTSLSKTYVTQLDEKFPLSCKSCGSEDISRASSSATQEVNSNSLSTKPSSTYDVIAGLRDRRLRN